MELTFLHCLHHITSKNQINKFVDKNIFDLPSKNKIRFKKPIVRTTEKNLKIKKQPSAKLSSPKNLKKISNVNNGLTNLFDNNLIPGNIVEHNKFGVGEVIQIEGMGNSKKAEIKFKSGSIKKLLLQFAKLKIIG